MPSTDHTDIASLILHYTWLCVNTTNWINPRFRVVLPSFDALTDLVSRLGITYEDELFDILQAPVAPSIKWFLSLPPDIPTKLWGIYALVFRKGKSYKLYIGSGTSSVGTSGVRTRINQHLRREVEPVRIRDAKNEGYVEVHETLLAWCPMPPPAHVPIFRATLIAIEAAFHLVFWPMYKKTTAYSFPAGAGPWPREDFVWGGLATHNPLLEGVMKCVDDVSLTADELNLMAKLAHERRKAVKRKSDRKLRANPTPEYTAFRRECSRRQQPKTEAICQANLAAKKFHCITCYINCRTMSRLRRHYATDRHKRNIADDIDDDCGLYCAPCNYQAPKSATFFVVTAPAPAMLKSALLMMLLPPRPPPLRPLNSVLCDHRDMILTMHLNCILTHFNFILTHLIRYIFPIPDTNEDFNTIPLLVILYTLHHLTTVAWMPPTETSLQFPFLSPFISHSHFLL